MQELASALRMDAASLVLLTEEVSVASSDAPAADGAPLADTIADPEDWPSAVELREMLCHLPEADRQLLHLRHTLGFTQAETARCMGLTQVQVSRREMLLRRQLRKAWYGT